MEIHGVQTPFENPERLDLLEGAAVFTTQQLQSHIEFLVRTVHSRLLQQPQLALREPLPHERQQGFEPLLGIPLYVVSRDGVGHDIAVADKAVGISENGERGKGSN